ncbi:universal stress protein [Aeromicrobium sp. A1-2]|uniref:universal stress protein n=1 Tax=Aeromicrobium sp. A1-2 TaxID=2107713 RepID=UPI0013C2A870|nr:universal stress protein [Aeromicrobium sp. A1-2]
MVGIADTEDGALGLALRRAEQHKCGLRVVHAFDVPGSGLHSTYTPAVVAGFEEGGQAVLDRAREVISSLDPKVDVEYALVRGRASLILLDESSSAREIVIGPDDSPWYVQLFQGRVAKSLAAHGRCPVTVVPDGWSSEGSPELVIVALDGESNAHGPVSYAFDVAQLEGRSLEMLHVVEPDKSGAAVMQRWGEMSHLLESWRRRFPQVRVRTVVVPGGAVAVSREGSAEASLLVAGRSSTHGVDLFARPFAQEVIRSSHCPVVVVPTDYRA